MLRSYPYLLIIAIAYTLISYGVFATNHASIEYVSLENRVAGIIAVASMVIAYFGYDQLEEKYDRYIAGSSAAFLVLDTNERAAWYGSLTLIIMIGLGFNLMA